MLKRTALSAALLCAMSGASHAADPAVEALVKALVDQKILTPEKAQEVMKAAQASTAAQQTVETAPPASEPGVVRVQRVPKFMQDEIRQQVRAELKEEVVQDVLAQSKSQGWGLPGTLPGWLDNIKFKGDLRLRGQRDSYGQQPGDLVGDDLYVAYPDFQKINEKRKSEDSFGNEYLLSDSDRDRLRVRARVGMDVKINTNWKTAVRLSTGSATDPVSTNQTLGNTGRRYTTTWDQAFVKYDAYERDGFSWFTFSGGRMPNPFVSTELVWDGDLAFEGVAATYRYSLHGDEDLGDLQDHSKTLFATLGAFPLQEVDVSQRDKWLYGAQLGGSFQFEDQDSFNLALAYYDFKHIQGEKNPLDQNTSDWTAPQFVQKGNAMFNIANPSASPSTDALYALAADYRLLNLTTSYTFAEFAPTQVTLTADYVKNIGFDKRDVEERLAASDSYLYNRIYDKVYDADTGYQLMATFGWPVIAKARDWNVTLGYRRLESDAVVDAFADSDFHLGGTDAEGWFLGGQYGLSDNVWLAGRWLSSTEINGSPLEIDTLQLDLNAKF